MQMRLEAKGFAEAFRRLGELTPRLERNVIAGANRAAMRQWEPIVRAAAPVRRPATPGSTVMGGRGRARRVPGHLRRSIKFRQVRRSKRPGALAHVLHKGPAFYARFVIQGKGRVRRRNAYFAAAFLRGRGAATAMWRRQFVKGFNAQVRRLNRG